MTMTTLYGASYSVYVRIARMALEEKAVNYHLNDVDIFAETPPPERERHPFHRIPTFRHDGFDLYETAAIVRYIDDRFPGPPLIPDSAKTRARMNQIISILDNYAYFAWVWGLYVQRISNPADGTPTDEDLVAKAILDSRKCLSSISELRDNQQILLVGNDVSLADLYAVPMYAYLIMTDEGRNLSDDTDWPQWWETMRKRDSVFHTRFEGET